MSLHEKLEKLRAKQLEIERQLEAQAAIEHAAVAAAFKIILSSSPQAYRLAQTCSGLEGMGVRERKSFTEWLSRVEAPAQHQPAAQAQGNHFGSTNNQSG